MLKNDGTVKLSGSGERVYRAMEQIKNLDEYEKNLLVKCIEAAERNDIAQVVKLLRDASR